MSLLETNDLPDMVLYMPAEESDIPVECMVPTDLPEWSVLFTNNPYTTASNVFLIKKITED